MRIGIKFAREGRAAYVSHLDMQRLFARALRRTGLPVKFSEGFNPHIILSFATAMGVGLETQGDYLEFQTLERVTPNEVETLLNAQMPEGLSVLAAGELPEGGKKLMALVDSSTYQILLPGEVEPFKKQLAAILEQETCMAKKTKKGRTKEVDIRPLIYSADLEKGIFVHLAFSGKATLNPGLLADVVSEKLGEPFLGRIRRLELYYLDAGNTKPLEHLFL